MELYASGIYPKIFTRIDSLFQAGEGTLGFLTKHLHVRGFVARYAMLRPVRGKRCPAPRGDSTRILYKLLYILTLLEINYSG